MTSLLDIVPAKKSVPIQGHNIEVVGVSITGIAVLLAKFPQVRNLFQGDVRAEDWTPEALTELAPGLVGEVLAAGTGHPGDADHVAAADRLPLGDQADLLLAIVDATLPKGVGPFVESVKAAMARASGAGMKARDSKSRKPPNA